MAVGALHRPPRRLGTAFAALFFGSILFLTDVRKWSVLQAGFGVAPGPVAVGLVAPQVGKLAGRIGQRPILITGGVLFAGSGLFRLMMLGPHVTYLGDFFPSMVLSGLGVAFVLPQLSSVVAQALPPGRAGVGGAVAQAFRQFGGTFGVALTIVFLGASGASGAVIDGFDPIWWIVVGGGLATSALVIPMHTSKAHRHVTGIDDAAAERVVSPAYRSRGETTSRSKDPSRSVTGALSAR